MPIQDLEKRRWENYAGFWAMLIGASGLLVFCMWFLRQCQCAMPPH